MRAALLVGLVACTSKPAPTACSPAGEKCSPLAPYGIEIGGPVIHRELAYTDKIALGGTAHFTILVRGRPESGEIIRTPLDAPYTATIDTTGIALEQNGNVVTLRSSADSGDRLDPRVGATLEIRDGDGLPLGQRDVGIAPIASMGAMISTYEQYNRDGDPVFAAGGPVVITLLDDAADPRYGDDPLWDDSMRVAGATQLAWDLIAAPPVTSAVTITAGDHSAASLTIPVASGVSITASAGFVESDSANVCFEARSADGHQVYGADWQYTVDGMPVATPRIAPNCIYVPPMGTVVVTAAGATLTVTLPVI